METNACFVEKSLRLDVAMQEIMNVGIDTTGDIVQNGGEGKFQGVYERGRVEEFFVTDYIRSK